MPCDAVLALGDQRHLVAVGIGQRLGAASPSRAISRPMMPEGAARRQRTREWFIFRIEPFM